MEQKPAPNLQKGQICLLHESVGKHSPKTYKYCKVTEVFHSEDGLVRTVSVQYFNAPSLRPKSKQVDVKRLTALPDATKEQVAAELPVPVTAALKDL